MLNSRIVLGVLVLNVALSACGGESQKYDQEAIDAVKATVTVKEFTYSTYKTGPLEGGVAVLSSRSAAYWVKDGKVYIANGWAKTASPGVPQAVGRSHSEIETAVQ